MNKRDAITTVREMLQVRAYEAQRLEVLYRAVRPSMPWAGNESSLAALTMDSGFQANIATVPVDRNAPDAHKRMAARSETNLLPLVLDTFSQVLKVDNYLPSQGDESASAWRWWQRNQMDARQTGLHRGALHYGVSYSVILPAMTPGQEDVGQEVFWHCASPRQLTAVYGDRMSWDPRHGGPIDDDWPMHALEINGNMIRLYDEQSVHFVGVKSQPHSALGWRDETYLREGNFEYIESRNHGVGVCPVVRYRDKVNLDGEEQLGIVEPLLVVQSRLNETTYGMLIAQYYAAFKQRYIIGWVPKSESESLKMKANNVWTFDDENVKVGELNETDLTRYIESKKSAVMDMSAMAQLPPHAMGMDGISNISETTLSALEAAKERKGEEITTAFGEAHEQAFRLSAHIAGDSSGAEDFESEVKWRDISAQAYSAALDALGKQVQMLGYPDELAWEDIPGMTRTKLERAKKARADMDPLKNLYDVPDSPAEPQVSEAQELKQKADAVGVLVRAGVDPEVAARQAGLDGLEFIDGRPITLKYPDEQ